jgi:hypothetical protein
MPLACHEFVFGWEKEIGRRERRKGKESVPLYGWFSIWFFINKDFLACGSNIGVFQ